MSSRQFERSGALRAATAVQNEETLLRRTILAACTTLCATAALAMPSTAPAASECVAKQDLDACADDVSQFSPQAGAVIRLLAHPEDIIVCVRECGAP